MEVENARLQTEVELDDSAVAEEEVEDLKQELVALIADKQYHEFVDDIVKNKTVAEDVNDKDYDPAEDGGVHSSGRGSGADSNEDCANGEKNEGDQEDQGDACSSSDSSGAEDEAEDEANVDSVEVKIPMDMLTEAEKRFPPFWRTKQALRNLETGSYKSEDDLDYVPEAGEDASQEGLVEAQEVSGMDETGDYRKTEDAGTDSEDESDEEAGDELDEVEMKEEVENLRKDQQSPVQPDVSSLVEMVEMMTLPPEESETYQVDNSETESMDEEGGVDERPENILTFDADGYVSAEDPDFVPDEKEGDDLNSSASSEGESSDEVDEME